ncbi:CoA transferase subunit A [Bacillus sp. SCS-151]|uniref:CoA transferase subunit A n=1 Tax=Nanhaiella sioensis TaxID=3115293 RepID=UPI003978E030
MSRIENSFKKIVTAYDAVKQITDNSTLMFGGFGGVGSPPTLIDEILSKRPKNLTLIGNDAGFPEIGIGKIVCEGLASKLIASHIGSNPVAGKLMSDDNLTVEFSPQGTLVERIRAGGVGLGGILVDIGIDNETVNHEKERITVDGKEYLLESPLTADVAIIYAKKSDPFGNLIYDKTAQNTNPLVAMAGNYTIAEVEEIVPLGHIHPEEIVTPGIFVNSIVQSKGVNWSWVWE